MQLPDSASAVERYTDAADIAPWALEAVEAVTACGLMEGYNHLFSPRDGATRAQGATILIRLMDLEPDAEKLEQGW